MANIVIREFPRGMNCHPSYRGTEGNEPGYDFQLPEDHPLTEAVLAYARRYGDEDAMLTADEAFRIAELYMKHLGKRFDVLECVLEEGKPVYDGVFLGYDLSYGFGNSLLSHGLTDRREPPDLPKEHPFWSIEPIYSLVDIHFSPRLNEYMLFESIDDARFCLECMMTIQSIQPGTYEFGDYEVVGVYLLNCSGPGMPQ